MKRYSHAYPLLTAALLTVMGAVATAPPGASEPRTGDGPSMAFKTTLGALGGTPTASPTFASFGVALRLLSGKHPRLNLGARSMHRSFRFCSVFGAKRIEKATPRNFDANDYKATMFAGWVVRRRNRAAALLLLPFGACAYWASKGASGFTAFLTPRDGGKVVLIGHGTPVAFYVRKKKRYHGGALLTEALSVEPAGMKPRVSLRLFGAISAGLRAAQGVHFLGYPSPTLSFGRFPRRGVCDTARVVFDLRPGRFFPISSVCWTRRRVGHPTTYGWIGVQRASLPGGVVIHSVRAALKHSGLPWRAGHVANAWAHYALRWLPNHGREPPLSPRYIALRKRFVEWATARGPKKPKR
jgi:hypothetical protein